MSKKTEEQQYELIQKIVELYGELGWQVLFLVDEKGNVPAMISGTSEAIFEIQNSLGSLDAIAESMGVDPTNFGKKEEIIDIEVTDVIPDLKKKTFH